MWQEYFHLRYLSRPFMPQSKKKGWCCVCSKHLYSTFASCVSYEICWEKVCCGMTVLISRYHCPAPWCIIWCHYPCSCNVSEGIPLSLLIYKVYVTTTVPVSQIPVFPGSHPPIQFRGPTPSFSGNHCLPNVPAPEIISTVCIKLLYGFL